MELNHKKTMPQLNVSTDGGKQQNLLKTKWCNFIDNKTTVQRETVVILCLSETITHTELLLK